MTRLMLIVVFALTGGAASATADEDVDNLCTDLINSIAANDLIAYAQCWSTIRHTTRGMKTLFPNLTDKDMQRIEDKFHARNTTIRHSFRVIREQVTDPNAKIQFVSAETRVKTETIGDNEISGFSMLLCRFRVNEQEWLLKLDDGILLDNRWFLSDDPVSLETHEKRIKLRKFKGKYGHVTEK